MDLVASAVMQRRVKTVSSTMTLDELETTFSQTKVSGFAVVDDGKLVGIVSRTDAFHALSPDYDITQIGCGDENTDDVTQQPDPGVAKTLGDRASQLYVKDIMTSDVVTVSPNDRLHEVADLMYKNRIHRILVVEGHELVGIITPFDFVRLYSDDRIGFDGRPFRTLDF